MKPTMLVSGGDTPLGNSIVGKALSSYNVAVTTSELSAAKSGQRDREARSREDSTSPVLVPWSRQSPVSARNVVLQTLACYDGIEAAVVVHGLTREKRILHELPLNVIQEITDAGLKSHLFLLKEIITHFLKRGSGILGLVIDRSGTAELTMMDSLVTEGFTALVKSLMSAYRDGPITINAFESAAADTEASASYILSALSSCDRSGKWFSIGDRNGIFRGGLRSKTKR